MPRYRSPLLTACVLLTLAAAQLFGLHRGFLCDCGGFAQVTVMDHCHGPHSAHCHEHETPCHDSDDHHGDEGDTHEHEELIETLLAQSADAQGSLVPPVIDLVSVLPAWLGTPVQVAAPPPGRPPATTAAPPRCRTWSAVLAHRIVLRV